MASSSSSAYPAIQTPSSQSFVDDRAYPGILNYVDPSVDVAHVRRALNGDDSPVEASWKSVECQVQNARAVGNRSSPCSLDREGCELKREPLDTTINFRDSADVMDKYYPLCEQLLRERLGSGSVQVTAFDHNVRMAEPPSDSLELANGNGASVQTPLGMVHGDYTAVSGPRRIQDLAQPPKQNDVWRQRLPEGEALLDPQAVSEAVQGKRRFALINVWRSIDDEHPVTSYPLAFINAQTVQPQDLRTLQIHYADRIGENYLAAPSETHEWLFYPEMTFDEALLIKQWDSAGLLAQDGKETLSPSSSSSFMSTFAIHSAFGLPPDCGVTPRPRKSIEVRCVCLWAKEDGDD